MEVWEIRLRDLEKEWLQGQDPEIILKKTTSFFRDLFIEKGSAVNSNKREEWVRRCQRVEEVARATIALGVSEY
jgi:hypothetical protein